VAAQPLAKTFQHRTNQKLSNLLLCHSYQIGIVSNETTQSCIYNVFTIYSKYKLMCLLIPIPLVTNYPRHILHVTNYTKHVMNSNAPPRTGECMPYTSSLLQVDSTQYPLRDLVNISAS